jgi:hypothetical protein
VAETVGQSLSMAVVYESAFEIDFAVTRDVGGVPRQAIPASRYPRTCSPCVAKAGSIAYLLSAFSRDRLEGRRSEACDARINAR